MPDNILVVARFNASGYFALTDEELGDAKNMAKTKLFGPSKTEPEFLTWLQPAFFEYIGTPASGEGGWIAIIKGDQFKEFSETLRGPLSKCFHIEIYYLNRTDKDGNRTVATFDTMVPAGNHWK